MGALRVVEVEVLRPACVTSIGDAFVSVQMGVFVLDASHSRSRQTLSTQRPLPSMLILMSCL